MVTAAIPAAPVATSRHRRHWTVLLCRRNDTCFFVHDDCQFLCCEGLLSSLTTSPMHAGSRFGPDVGGIGGGNRETPTPSERPRLLLLLGQRQPPGRRTLDRVGTARQPSSLQRRREECHGPRPPAGRSSNTPADVSSNDGDNRGPPRHTPPALTQARILMGGRCRRSACCDARAAYARERGCRSRPPCSSRPPTTAPDGAC